MSQRNQSQPVSRSSVSQMVTFHVPCHAAKASMNQQHMSTLMSFINGEANNKILPELRNVVVFIFLYSSIFLHRKNSIMINELLAQSPL